MKMTSSEIKAITGIIKKKFPNLTVEQVIDIATEILDELYKVANKQT